MINSKCSNTSVGILFRLINSGWRFINIHFSSTWTKGTKALLTLGVSCYMAGILLGDPKTNDTKRDGSVKSYIASLAKPHCKLNLSGTLEIEGL